MKNAVTIAAASAGDAQQVIALWEACGLTRPWNDPGADFRRAVESATSCVLIARGDGGAIEASAMVGSDGHRGWVYYLAVDPDRRRAGLGRAMMEAAESWLREQGISRVRLMVRTGNAAAEFYQRIGYEALEVTTMGKTLG
jgi:ribosomal protein S18 acetylase RimI-like enzyme